MGLCCIASDVSAIPELITDGVTGRLVPPGDRVALAAALTALMRDPETRRRLGRAAAAHVRSTFAADPGLDRLAERFRAVLGR